MKQETRCAAQCHQNQHVCAALKQLGAATRLPSSSAAAANESRHADSDEGDAGPSGMQLDKPGPTIAPEADNVEVSEGMQLYTEAGVHACSLSAVGRCIAARPV